MSGLLTDERLARLGDLARTLVNDYRLMGRWSWYGDAELTSAYLATKGNGRRYVMGAQAAHLHWSWNPAEEPEVVTPTVANDCSGKAGSADCSHSADRYAAGRLAADHPMPAFPVKGSDGWPVLRRGDEIPVFEVCPEATSAADKRVYRTTIVGFRSPVAEYMAEVDAETVLQLVKEVTRLRAALAERQEVPA